MSVRYSCTDRDHSPHATRQTQYWSCGPSAAVLILMLFGPCQPLALVAALCVGDVHIYVTQTSLVVHRDL